MSLEKEVVSKIEEIMQYRRSKDPFYVELDKIYNDMFPIKQFQSIMKLNQAYVWSVIKNKIYLYLETSDKEMFDGIFKTIEEDDEMKNYINKLSK